MIFIVDYHCFNVLIELSQDRLTPVIIVAFFITTIFTKCTVHKITGVRM
jgi:hypothetical protein